MYHQIYTIGYCTDEDQPLFAITVHYSKYQWYILVGCCKGQHIWWTGQKCESNNELTKQQAYTP